MVQNDISTWLQFALQQIAAESYLSGIDWNNPIALRDALVRGNNRQGFVEQNNTRMSVSQATAFVQKYSIVDHHANDATGFSATLIQERDQNGQLTNNFTLSFRSLEYQDQAQGGDWERDGRDGAAGEVATQGFAFGQLVSMERYYRELKADPTKLPPGAVLNVTGYSLGGHLATVFTELHTNEVNHTYTFNGAGRGEISGGTAGLSEAERIGEMLDVLEFNLLTLDPEGTMFRSGGGGNVQTDARYQAALLGTKAVYTTTISTLPPGEVGTGGAFAKITQLFGHATSGVDTEIVANSGVHGSVSPILIEGQPLLEGLNQQRELQYGNSHSITLLVDSLAMQELFQTVDPNLTQAQMETIFKASSDAKAGLFGQTHVAEGDTLELALDALRKVFLDAGTPPTNFNDNAGGFGDPAFRNEFYAHLAEVKTQLATTFAGQTFRIQSLVGQPSNDMRVAADGTEPTSLAYRFALKELTPFVVLGSNDMTTHTLYDRHNETGELALVNPETGIGELTPQYLIDRAAFLAKKIEVNSTASSGFNFTHFHDTPSGYDIAPILTLRQMVFGDGTNETFTGGIGADHFYGGSGGDQLRGLENADYLEGNRGDDTLDGGSGADTMLGGQGNDIYFVDNVGDVAREYANSGIDEVRSSVTFTLDSQVENLTLTGTSDINGTGNELDNLITGNSGINRLDGQSGTDHLIGGDKNDILIGGTGDNDLLEGGAGFDTYIYNVGDGADQIEDSDATGKIVFNGGLLQGGISTDGGATYVSLDGSQTYVLSGGHLIVNGVLTVNANFQSGQFGIQLKDLSGVPSDPGAPTGPFPIGDANFGGADADYFSLLGNPFGPQALYGNGGDDALNAWVTSADITDLLDGGPGDDTLIGGAGRDYLIGGEGADFGNLTDGDIFVGGDGNDIAVGDTDISNFVVTNIGNGAYYADGGDGADTLLGALGGDVLYGGAGDDTLRGENRPEGWTARIVGFDGLYHDYSMAAYFSPIGAADVLFGEAGNDLLVGDGGDDILSGGADNDQLFGDDETGYLVVPGDDILDGGAGDDLLVAGDGSDSLSGGAGIDTLFGDKGDDVLDGGDDADTMLGGDGADELFGGGGNDLLFGDGLNNQFVAGTVGGDDFLDGGDGDDELQGGVGADMLSGGAGNDFLLGQDDDDTIFGDEGDDELQGGDGIDLLGGDAGDDLLLGDAGDDELFGDTGHDQLGGNDGNDLLLGGVGNDILEGGKGNDVLIGGVGNDVYNFSLGDGQDTITDAALVGEGNFINFFPGITLNSLTFNHDQATQTLTIQVGGGADAITLLGFDPNTFRYAVNALRFSDGSFVALADQLPLPGGLIEGTNDNNVIRTGSSDDTIFAGGGNDLVNSGAGNDQLIGGAGNDALFGGAGQDTYFVNNGDGVDTITEATGEGNRIIFGAGVSSDALTLGTAPGGTLVINYGSTGNQVRLASSLVSLPTIDTFQFADGTTLTFAELVSRGIVIVGTAGNDFITAPDNQPYIIQGFGGDDVLFGGAGNDTVEGGAGSDVLRGGSGSDTLVGGEGNDSLEGEDGNDLLIGGTGDDQLLGGAGADVYQFNLGDGLDSISDPNAIGEESRVMFGSGINSSSITLTTSSGQVIVRPGTAGDGVLNGANRSDVLGFRAVDLFQFTDGTSITYAELVARGFDIEGTEFDDFLFGTNVIDRFSGGLGNDRMEGGEAHDSYVFNLGDGVDTIVDTASAGAGNEVVFGPGIASTDLRLDVASDPSGSLLVHVGTDGDALQLTTFDRQNVFGPRTVETLRFADGSTLTHDQLLARGFDLTGTAGDDQLNGTNSTDRIVAGDGDDVLRSGAGDDTLEGGAGNDRLLGGQDNDTYEFGPGSGHDTIVESQGVLDTIRMAAGVAPSDVVVTRNNHDLVLSLNGGADRVTVSLYFLAAPLQIERVQFADGTVWDQAFIGNLLQPTITGSGGPDVLVGTSNNDRLAGLAGDDQVAGLAGNDLLDGGTGADQLTGDAGDDTYIVDDAGDVVTELANDGTDTIQSSVTRTLDANVERLTLTGTAAINGTGNDLDNVLTGSSAANVLTGGQSNDTYVLGAGDTVVELAGEGIDTVQTGVSATLGANLENLTLIGSASLIGTGNELDNVLQGDGSISILAGGVGNDTYMVGSNGDDDILVETTTDGIDTVIAAHDYRLPANIENLTLLDPMVPDFANFSLIPHVPYGPPWVLVAGYGNDLNNTLIGGRANNVLDGGLGVDSLIGGKGDDTYLVDNASDVVSETAGEGTDVVQSLVSYTLSSNVEWLDLTGTAAISATGNAMNNVLVGNSADNFLDGGAGNDFLNGEEGADTYFFGRGSGQDEVFDYSLTGEVDTIQLAQDVLTTDLAVYQRPGELVLTITGADDTLTLASFFGPTEYVQKQVRFSDGTVWNEAELRTRAVAVGGTINGTTSDDSLVGTVGHDTLNGGDGHDVLRGEGGDDVLDGDAGFFIGATYGFGNDTLLGGAGHDILRDAVGTNIFDGGSGNDSLFLGSGQDTVLFGRGSEKDTVYFDNAGADIDLIQMAADISPNDVILTRHYPYSNILDLRITTTGDQLTLNLSTAYPVVDGATTQGKIVFADGTQWNLSWAPADSTLGSPGDDLIDGSFPATFRGFDGDDTYLLGSSGVAGVYAVIETADGGVDTVESLVDYTLNAHVENLVLAESRSSVIENSVHGTGNELDNLIVGNTGDNVLDGGAGNDVLVGGFFRSVESFFVFGTGSDILIGGAGDDVLMADGGNVAFPADGFEGAWLFVGGGSDFLEAVPREADDLLIGGTGNDTYILHSQQQTVAEFANEGTDTVRSTVSYTLGEHVENLVLVDPAAIYDNDDNLVIPPPLNGTGNDLDNLLIGSGKDNLLTGGVGNDTLWGGNAIDIDSGLSMSGNDILAGGSGHDTYIFKVGDEIDTVSDIAFLGEGNRIQFGAGIGQSDLTFTHDEAARTLTIQVGTSGADQLLLTNFDPTNVNGSLVVEALAFADGSTASLAELLGLDGPVNHAPTVATPLADQTVPEDAPFSLVMPANMFADQDAADMLTLSASLADGTALPSWLGFDAATRTFTGMPDDAQVGSLDLKVTATDTGNLSVSDVFTLTVTNVNEVPTVAMPLADQQATEDARFNFVVPANIFADADHVHGDQLAYSATLSDGSALPSWLNFDSATRTFSGTPLNGDVGILNIDVTATDGGALSSTDSFALTVQNVNDAPTVMAPIADQTAAEDSVFALTVPTTTFADEDVVHGDQLTYSATLADGSALPTWLGFDPITHTFSGTPGAGDAGTIQIAVTATDVEALSETALFTLNVTRPLPQTIVGTTGNDVLTGGRGDDTLRGLAGHDVLDGGEGSDMMLGGTGSDTYMVDASGDVVTELPNEGFDTVIADVTTALSPNVEALVLAGSSAIDGTGNSLNNGLTGNNASNTLDGGLGADVMVGLDGDDTYVVDQSSDLAVELANHGIDTVRSAVTYALAANLEHLTLTGAAAINGTGNALDNVLVGNSAANRLTGRAGDDTYVVGAGDTVVESTNSGTDTVHSSITWTLGSNLEHLTLTGSSAINGTGNSASNVLTGNSANNVLSGANGADTLCGGLGNDTVNGGSGNDTFLFGRGEGQDLVQDNSGAADTILYDAGINPLDLVISRQANDLRVVIHGSPDQITVQNWYVSTTNRIETIQTGNGQTLLSTQVDQLIQAMAGFTAQTGLTWDQAIDQRPQEVQVVLAASWQ